MNLKEFAEEELLNVYGSMVESDDPADCWDNSMRKGVLAIVELFAEQGHSGLSGSTAVAMINRVLNFKPLTKLTGEDNEWMQVEPNWYQNKRCSTVFKKVVDGKVVCWDIDIKDENQSITFPYWPC